MLEKTSAEIFHYNGQTGTTTRTELLFWLRLKTWDLRMYLTFRLIWKKLHEDSFSLYINSTQPEGLILVEIYFLPTFYTTHRSYLSVKK